MKSTYVYLRHGSPPVERRVAYRAEAIEHEGRYFYRVDGTTVEIRRHEFDTVIKDPNLFYFTTALRLDRRIKNAKKQGLGANWPDEPAAPLGLEP